MRTDAALMLLADGRFPSGGHAHSNGYEAADRIHGLVTPSDITSFVANRLTTSGLSESTMAAAIVAALRQSAATAGQTPIDWAVIDGEVEARIPAPALRERSRGLGRQWLRAGRRLVGHLVPDEMAEFGADGPHEVVAFAVVAHSVGLDPRQAALVFLHHLVSGITTAAVRLRGLDPYMVQGIQLQMLPTIENLADQAASLSELQWSDQSWSELPATTGPLFEIMSQDHASWDNRLFQS